MSKELFEGAVVAGKEKIRKLRKKQYLCIFVIAYMVFCMILLPDSLMFAIGLVVIGFAGFKFWKFRKEYNLHKTLLESNEGVLRAINSSEEEEYDDPNVTYSAADLLGTSSSKTTKKTKILRLQKLQKQLKQENLASNFEFYRKFLIFTSQTNYL